MNHLKERNWEPLDRTYRLEEVTSRLRDVTTIVRRSDVSSKHEFVALTFREKMVNINTYLEILAF